METIQIGGLRTAYRVEGTGDPVLFIHGFPLSQRLWDHMVEPLAGRYTLIMPDLRGMGGSEPSEEVSMEAYADDLSGLLKAIGESRPVTVVGLSMGGYIAFEFFRRHRARTKALVLADTRASGDSPETAKTRMETAAKVMADGSSVVANAMAPKLFGKSAPESLVEEWRGIMSATSPQGVAAALRAMAVRPDSNKTLPEIDVPTLIIVGEEDAITPPAESREMHAKIRNAQIKLIPDAGHMTPVEKPQAFARILGEFLGILS